MSDRNRASSHHMYSHAQFGHIQPQIHPISGPGGVYHIMQGNQPIASNMAAMNSSWGTPQAQGNHLMPSHLAQASGMVNQMMPPSVFPFQYPLQQPFYASNSQAHLNSINSMGVVQSHQHGQVHHDALFSSGYYPQQFSASISVPNEASALNTQISSEVDMKPTRADLKSNANTMASKTKKGQKRKTIDEAAVPQEQVNSAPVESSKKEKSSSGSSRQRKKSVQLSDAALENRKKRNRKTAKESRLRAIQHFKDLVALTEHLKQRNALSEALIREASMRLDLYECGKSVNEVDGLCGTRNKFGFISIINTINAKAPGEAIAPDQVLRNRRVKRMIAGSQASPFSTFQQYNMQINADEDYREESDVKNEDSSDTDDEHDEKDEAINNL